MSYYYLKEVDFMLNKIHEFVYDMQMGALLSIPIMAALYILLGIVHIITGVINKKVN